MHAKFGVAGIRAASAYFIALAVIFAMHRVAVAQEMRPTPIYDVNAMTPDQIVTRDQLTDEEANFTTRSKIQPLRGRSF